MSHAASLYLYFYKPVVSIICKIGYAADVKQRVDELNRSTAAPFAFRIYAAYEVDSVLSDKRLHSVLDKLKRTNEKVYLGVSETLVKRSELFNYKTKHYYLFSKSGFTKGCEDKAKKIGNVNLVEYGEIIENMQGDYNG